MKKTNTVFNNLYNSPTIMTWFSFSAKSLSILVVLPLILIKFNTNEISLWFLFGILSSIQMVADLGFGSTFTRLISFAMAGLKSLDDINREKPVSQKPKEPNFGLIKALNKKMKVIFLCLGAFATILLGCFSFLFLDKPIENLETPQYGYNLLILILGVLFFKIYSKQYSSYICGVGEVALLRRWEGILTYLQISSSLVVLLLSENFYFLVINNQLWVLIGVLNINHLSKKVTKEKFPLVPDKNAPLVITKEVFGKHVISPSYKSGIGNLTSYSVNSLVHFVLVDYLSEDSLAIFLFTSKIVNLINEFSRVPFYAQLPFFAQQFPVISRQKLSALIQRSINRSIFLATAGLVTVLFLGEIALKMLGGQINSFNHDLWFIFSLNLLCERTGAMHFQMHSVSNNVTWHKANLIYAFFFSLVIVLTIDILGIYAIPMAMLASNLMYYTPCALKTSHNFFSYNFVNFTREVFICIIFLIICYLVFFN